MARGRKTSGGSSGTRRIKQLLLAAVGVAALVFAVQGGEYGTRDLVHMKRRRAVLVKTNDSLQRIVDSLKKYKRRVETDAALQERIVREEFGLVRGGKEILYRFVEPDSVVRVP